MKEDSYHDTSVSTYVNGVYQTMGTQTFWYQLYHRASLALGLLVLAVALAIATIHIPVAAEMAHYLRLASRISFGLAFVVGIIAYIAARVVYRNTTFALTDDALKIRRGVWRKEELAIPYRQIQNIEIERSFEQRILGLSTMIILTAARDYESTKGEAPESVLPIIDTELAIHLQDELLRRLNAYRITEVTS